MRIDVFLCFCYDVIGGDNMSTEAHIRASMEYNKKRDCLVIRPDNTTGAAIREAAEKAGQSVQQYILQAVKERMERE